MTSGYDWGWVRTVHPRVNSARYSKVRGVSLGVRSGREPARRFGAAIRRNPLQDHTLATVETPTRPVTWSATRSTRSWATCGTTRLSALNASRESTISESKPAAQKRRATQATHHGLAGLLGVVRPSCAARQNGRLPGSPRPPILKTDTNTENGCKSWKEANPAVESLSDRLFFRLSADTGLSKVASPEPKVTGSNPVGILSIFQSCRPIRLCRKFSPRLALLAFVTGCVVLLTGSDPQHGLVARHDPHLAKTRMNRLRDFFARRWPRCRCQRIAHWPSRSTVSVRGRIDLIGELDEGDGDWVVVWSTVFMFFGNAPV